MPPLFEFRCEKCNIIVERLLSYCKSLEFQQCETCKSEMKKQIATPNFKLIGDGFYKPSKTGND